MSNSDRSVNIGGNASGNIIITGDGNTVGNSDNDNNSPDTILFLAANPSDSGRLRLDKEAREIAESLQRANYRERFQLKHRWAVRSTDIRRALLDETPRIVHFCGHGAGLAKIAGTRATEEPEKESAGGIYVEGENGESRLIPEEALTGLFEIFKDEVKTVVLNACFTQSQAEAIAKHIPHVIGMRSAIDDEAAILFASGFYDGLGAGRTVEQAFKIGCNAIQFYDLPDHLTPILL